MDAKTETVLVMRQQVNALLATHVRWRTYIELDDDGVGKFVANNGWILSVCSEQRQLVPRCTVIG